jgi:tRNA-specific 2-thiouridylase
VAGVAPAEQVRCTVKTRYRQRDQDCEVSVGSDGRCLVRTRDLQRAVTPGQSAVFYAGEVCLGGGIIARAGRSGRDHAFMPLDEALA